MRQLTMSLLAVACAATHPCVKGGTALASCFGFDAADATGALQTAFGSGAGLVIVDDVRGQPWIVRPLFLNASNIHVRLDPGVVVYAKQDEFHGVGDSLLTVAAARNVTISGGAGSLLRMRRDDYAVPPRGTCPSCRPYTKAEWRSTLTLKRSASGVRVFGLRMSESGGDGISQDGAENVHIADCVLETHYRQGMSVVSARGLLVERCLFAATEGTPPMAGIDVEPDRPDSEMSGVVIRDSAFRGNVGGGLLMNLHHFNASTAPVDVRVLNVSVDGEATPGVGIGIGNVVGVNGTIHVADSTVRHTGGCGLAVYRKAPDAAHVTIRDTSFADVALGRNGTARLCAPQGACTPLVLLGAWGPRHVTDVGGVDFERVAVADGFDRAFLTADDANYSVRNVVGVDLEVTNPHGCSSVVQRNRSGVRLGVRCHTHGAVTGDSARV